MEVLECPGLRARFGPGDVKGSQAEGATQTRSRLHASFPLSHLMGKEKARFFILLKPLSLPIKMEDESLASDLVVVQIPPLMS